MGIQSDDLLDGQTDAQSGDLLDAQTDVKMVKSTVDWMVQRSASRKEWL